MTSQEQDQHVDVGAFVLGVLEEEDAARFETHLGECERCAAEFDALAGLEPILAEFAESAPDVESLTAQPGPVLLDRLLEDVAATRRTRGHRRLYLVAAAAVLIVGGPIAASAVTSSDTGHDHRFAAEAAFDDMPAGNKVENVDPATKVDATVGVERRDWGSHVVLQLTNLKGPLKCRLIAVGKNGDQQTVTTWSVPKWGYGNPHAKQAVNRKPLYMHGGSAMWPSQIDHFEVRTFDGRALVDVNAPRV
jgi:Putative zinc-finger